MSQGRFKNPVEATLTGIKDLFRKQDLASALTESDRLDGKTCLVTGANTGLGFGIAVELARRGAHLIMACRSGIPEKGEEVKRLSGSDKVEMRYIDLSNFETVHAFCAQLAADGVRLDVMVSNAGVAPPHAIKTVDGFDEIFQVNFLAKVLLYRELLHSGVIPNSIFSKGDNIRTNIPRIVFISSDSHQGASEIDWEEFGRYEEYGIRKAMSHYSYYKLVMNTYATELSRRLSDAQGKPKVSVNVMCPGPVDSDIVRKAPTLLKGFMKIIFKIFFRSPAKAALPVAYLCASDAVEGKTNYYLHMFNEKRMDAKCYDAEAGKKLWERAHALLMEGSGQV
ncbi:MAG: SDR family NAD(P)-dependent oxidoreductase [Lewinellaceae bacterium]|nr:SDR family NAD(P)-dependent oxidoreductase [Lewinellaceae bacterium]